ncbi:hypothetical protein ERJ75_000449900 [Trypanosoma vivax]|nr:hypothetical protein ERJ75_000449900 [Trypanosoma vivax]
MGTNTHRRSTAIDKARRLADHAQTAAELALGLVNAWNAPSRRGLNGHEEQSEAHEPEDARTRDKRGNRTGTQETHSSETDQECNTHGRHMDRGQVPAHCASRRKRKRAHRNAHNIQHAMRAGMMLAALVVKTPA